MDVGNLLASWFSSEAWRREASNLPAPERRTWLADLGEEFFRRNVGNFSDELLWNLALVNWIWPGPQMRQLAHDHAAHLFSGLSDSLDFLSGNPELSSVEYVNSHWLKEALDGREGTILVGAFQSHPGFLLAAPDLRDFQVAVIRKAGEPEHASLTLAGLHHVEELPASVSAVRRMLELLRQGQVIAVYADYVYSGSATIESALFGYRAALSRSLISIAMRTRSRLLPFAVARSAPRERSSVTVEFFPTLDTATDDEGSLALRLGVVLECLIRRYPAQWRLWNTLRNRCY